MATLNSVSLQYDGFGRRTKNLQNTSFLFDGANAVQELSGSTPTANLTSGGIDEIFTRADSSGAYTPLQDALGSTFALVDASGNLATQYAYDPFGNTTVSGATNSNTFQYTGRENEGNGLYFYRARYYSPLLVAQRKTCWRAGKKYARVAEAPDIENHIHGLTIVNEPDAWPVNLYDKTAKHIVDPGPSLDVHTPIFTVRRQAQSELEQLEFGEELRFFTKNHAKKSVGETFNGKATARFDLKINGFSLSLWTDVASKKPARISLVDGPQTQTIEYLLYEDNLQFDPKLFQPPAGIVIKDVK